MQADASSPQSLGLQALDPSQCERIFLAALEILERVGVRVHEPQGLELLRQAGARVQGDRACLPSAAVRQALATAPRTVPIAARDGRPALRLEKGRSYFGSGSDTQFTFDLETGERRLSTKRDVANAARIADDLPHIDFVMSLGLASDVPASSSYLHQFEAMALNTTKPILYTAADRRDVEDILSIAEAIAGGGEPLAAHPFLVLYAEPTSPLQHSREAVEKLLLCARRRVPVMYIPAVMLGATAPVTIAGALAQINAECLSGLVMHQQQAPGAPFIYGGAAPAMDMRTSLCSYGSPELALSCAGMISMARWLELPVFCTAGCSDAHTFDPQAGMEAGYSVLAMALAGGNLIHDLGYVGAGMTSSMEMLALCDEAAGIARYLLAGIEVSSRTLALQTIEQVGPGGNFMAESHTVENFKDSLHFSAMMNRLEYARWREEGSLSLRERANRRVRGILARHRPAELPAGLVRAVQEVAARRDRHG
jgi:trimethylamine--corrinoid protein Co-methyltransferase